MSKRQRNRQNAMKWAQKGLIPFLETALKVTSKGKAKTKSPGTYGRKISLDNYQGFNESSIKLDLAETSISIGAGATKRTQSMLNITTYLLALVGTNVPGGQTSISKHHIKIRLSSSSPFVVIPFISILENGETLTGVDSSNSNIIADMEQTLGAQSSQYKVFPIKSVTRVDNANKYSTEITIPVTQFSKRWVEDYYLKQQNELTPANLVMELGAQIIGKASQTVSVTYIHHLSSNIVPRTTRKSFF